MRFVGGPWDGHELALLAPPETWVFPEGIEPLDFDDPRIADEMGLVASAGTGLAGHRYRLSGADYRYEPA